MVVPALNPEHVTKDDATMSRFDDDCNFAAINGAENSKNGTNSLWNAPKNAHRALKNEWKESNTWKRSYTLRIFSAPAGTSTATYNLAGSTNKEKV
jgi:hypothetical protein